MPTAVIEFFVLVAELAAKYGPGVVELGSNLVRAIESHAAYTDEQKAGLIARVKATRAAVAAYQPLPHAGSPSVEVPEPAPTPNVRGG